MRRFLIDWLTRLTLSVSALLVGGVSLFIFYGVFARYLLGSSPIWFDELARYMIIYAAILGIGAVWVKGGHMRVDVLEKKVPIGLSQLIIFYQWVVTLVLAGAMAWFSYQYAGKVGFFKTPGLQVSRTWPLLSFPIGFGFLFLLVLLKGPFDKNTQSVEET